MSIFRRLVTSVHASVDRTVAGIENHEAIVDAALRDSRAAVARARVKLTGLKQDGSQLRQRITQLENDAQRWNERAVSIAAQDRTKALECVRRSAQCERELSCAKHNLKSHESVEKSVQDSINQTTKRVQTLQQQRNQMRCREAAAQAKRTALTLNKCSACDVDSVMERWEISVGETELLTETATQDVFEHDDLTTEFHHTEENQRLENTLDQLLLSEQHNSGTAS